MEDEVLEEIKIGKNIEDFINSIRPYYPGLEISEYTIEEIEKSFSHFYIKLIGKLISFSPINMRYFLKDFLLKFEIINIKQIIMGKILGFSHEEISKNIDFLVEEYLENTEFIKKLITAASLDEVSLIFKRTLYNKAIREGILYYKNYKETFVLEAFLDQLYYQNLLSRERIYTANERKMIHIYNSLITEIYNINFIYRGILNKIDKKLIAQFLVDSYIFLERDNMEHLLSLNEVDDFFIILDKIFESKRKLKYYKKVSQSDHPLWELEKIYKTYYFNKFKLEMIDIDLLTIYKIMQVIIKKEAEIKFKILPTVIKIIHQKYFDLKIIKEKS
ncbi:MAG: V-type ATPase subunit [Promethearchaeota archaeon]